LGLPIIYFGDGDGDGEGETIVKKRKLGWGCRSQKL